MFVKSKSVLVGFDLLKLSHHSVKSCIAKLANLEAFLASVSRAGRLPEKQIAAPRRPHDRAGKELHRQMQSYAPRFFIMRGVRET